MSWLNTTNRYYNETVAGRKKKQEPNIRGQVHIREPVASEPKVRVPLWAWVLLILAFAILLRIAAHVQAYANDPSYGHIQQDESIYSNWAVSFSKGEVPTPLPFVAPPFYPFVLGNSIYRFFGATTIAAYIFNNLLALINMYLLFLLGAKVWNSRAGLIAAFIYNLYPPSVMLELKVMPETFFITFSLLAIYWGMLARDRRRPGAYFTAGLMMGLATIARPTFIIFIPVYLLWLLCTVKRFRTWLVTALLVLAGFIPPVIPITAANAIGGKDFVPLTTLGGLNFYIGNHEGAKGYLLRPPGISDLNSRTMIEDSRKIAEAETGRAMKPSEVSDFFFRKGLHFIRTDPARFIRLLSWKFRLLLSNLELSDVWGYSTTLKMIPILRWVGLPFAVIVTLTAFGIVWSWKRDEKISMLLAYTASFVVYLLAFFVNTRYRLPLVAVFPLFIGGGISSLIDKEVGTTRIYSGAVAGIIALLISLAPLSWISEGSQIAWEHFNLGTLYLGGANLEMAREQFLTEIERNPYEGKAYAFLAYTESKLGDANAAELHFKKALELSPDLASVYTVYGLSLFENGHMPEAEKALRRSIKLDPLDPFPAYLLAESLIGSGRAKEASDILENIPREKTESPATLQLLGKIQLDLGKVGEAETTLNNALQHDSENTTSRFYLGLALKGQGRYTEALGAFSETAKREPDYRGLQLAIGDTMYAMGDYPHARDAYLQGLNTEPESFELYHNLGLAYQRLGDLTSGAASLQKATELKPDYYQAFYNLGNIYIASGKADEGIANFERAIAIKPDFTPALLNLGTIYAQLGKYTTARDYWQRVINIAPDSKEASIAENNLQALEGSRR